VPGATSPTRRFLMKQPRPTKVRIHVTDEPVREMALGPGQSWNQIADSIDAFRPRLIEALDAAGAVIRANNDEQLADAAEAAPEVDRGGDPEDPTVPMQGDSQLETFARLLADAHRASGERSFEFVQIAFQKIVEIANVQTVRLDKMQGVLDSMQRRYMQVVSGAIDGEQENAGNDQGALLAQMLAQFMQGSAMAGKLPGNGTNGAPHGNGGK
jgi:hypothetical protein